MKCAADSKVQTTSTITSLARRKAITATSAGIAAALGFTGRAKAPASHAGQFGLGAKYQPGKAYSPDTFVDPDALPRILDRLAAQFQAELDTQEQEEQAIEDRNHFKDVTPN